MHVPFNRPTISPTQVSRIEDVANSGRWSGDGEQTLEASRRLGSIHGNVPVLLTTSCTAALEMAAIMLDLEPGDEVIVPSFTFVSTANAFVLMGARVVFADIDPLTLCISADSVESVISERTRAVVSVNYAGIQALPKSAVESLQGRGIVVIEDNAHGLFGHDKDGIPLGTYGDLSTLSFHETKNITCGEGGALVVNNSKFVERAEIVREKGTDRSRFFRGMVDKYTWVDRGSSYLPSEFNAAILNSQLDIADSIQTRRNGISNFYATELLKWAEDFWDPIAMQVNVGPGNPSHMFFMLLSNLDQRSKFLEHSKRRGATVLFHYVPLHSAPAGLKYGITRQELKVTSEIANRLVRLPLFSDMTHAEAEYVVEVVKSFK
jgi:dTDP-4-amino-4,6-dideoxygalactose transaminase